MNSRGFTLIEIVVALGVFLLGFVSVISLFLGGFSAQDEARSRVTRVIVAHNLFALFTEAEDPGTRTILADVEDATKSDIFESSDYPGYSYFFTAEPYKDGQNRVIITLYVFEAKFKEPLYAKEYDSLTADEKADYDKKCTTCCTIVEKE